MVDLRHGQRQVRTVQYLVRVVPGQAQYAARRGSQDRGEAAERPRRLLGGLRMAVRGGPVTAAGRDRDRRAMHQGQVVAAVRVGGQGHGQLGMAAGVIPAAQPELGLGQEGQRPAGEPDLHPGADPAHRQREVLRGGLQVTGP